MKPKPQSAEDRIARAHLGAMIARLGKGHDVRKVPVTVEAYFRRNPDAAAKFAGVLR